MSVRKWYGHREILLSGATSELGRNLLEKLLRCFPDVTVHIVVKFRHGQVTDRFIKDFFGSPGFERLQQERPDALSRVKVYEGNLVHNDLGLTENNQKKVKNVNVAFHIGESSTEFLKFCKKLPNLEAAVISGSIFKCKKDQVWEVLDDTEKLPIDIPVAMVQLSALGPAYRDPMPGYVDILKGATALMVGAGYMYGIPDLPVEIIPIDIAANTFVMTAWDLGRRNKIGEQLIYNASTINCTWGELIRKGDRASRSFRYPTFRVRGMTQLRLLHWLIIFFCEWLPSFICDTIFYLIGRKQRLLKEHKRIRKVLQDFESVTTRNLTVARRRIKELERNVNEEEKEAFPLRVDLDIEAYLLCAAAATRKYCVGESNLKIVTFFLPTILALVLLGCSYYYYFLL